MTISTVAPLRDGPTSEQTHRNQREHDVASGLRNGHEQQEALERLPQHAGCDGKRITADRRPGEQ